MWASSFLLHFNQKDISQTRASHIWKIHFSLSCFGVGLCLGWLQPCCLQNFSAPTPSATFCSAQLWLIVYAGQTHLSCIWGQGITAGHHSLPGSMSRQDFCKCVMQCSQTAKQSAWKWVLLICSWRRYLDGKAFQGRNYMFALISEPVNLPPVPLY